MSTTKPVIFISYSHKDEPEHPRGEEVAWLSFVRTYLQPAIKHGVFDLFVDEHIPGGAALKPEIEARLRKCDVFLLLISANSVVSDYIIDTEIAITRERQAKGEDVVFYPLLLTPTPMVALEKFLDMKVRPRDAKPLSSHPYNERIQVMSDIADEIAEIAAGIVGRKPPPPPRPAQPQFVHISGLPETPYEHLVGRATELSRLDETWEDNATNILSLIAEGGAGKSALVNEWLKRMQADNYRGAEAVLGWSFYSQGTKERATSADQFLNWALEKLGIKLETTSATAKGDAIAEALMRRRVLLVLDGVEPLQHGPDGQTGQLKDQGLRALLRRFSAPPPDTQGLIILTSRIPVTDISRWKDTSAPVLDVERLSDEAGAALLRDNGVWGTDKELKSTSHDFGGHPLALGLLASLLKETKNGDVRKRDHVRAFLADKDDPRHDHAVRVMESFEKEWLAGQPVLLSIMYIMGLFDRPADSGCLDALRDSPVIPGLTEEIVDLSDDSWNRATKRLREVRLLSPRDPAAPDTLDAHPLVREWFDAHMKLVDENAWKASHGRIFDHLCRTKEGSQPTLARLAPLYQAVSHGCRARRVQDALNLYYDRIVRSPTFYSKAILGAFGSDLAAVSWFFAVPYTRPLDDLSELDGIWALAEAASCLSAQGRLSEASAAYKASLKGCESVGDLRMAANTASTLSHTELHLGNISESVAVAKRAISHADRAFDHVDYDNDDMSGLILVTRGDMAGALLASGKYDQEERLWTEIGRLAPGPICQSSLAGNVLYHYFELRLRKKEYRIVYDLAQEVLDDNSHVSLLTRALAMLAKWRAKIEITLAHNKTRTAISTTKETLRRERQNVDASIEALRGAGQQEFLPYGLIARAALWRMIGAWPNANHDLNEVEEIAGSGPMRLHLCDLTLERARLAFAQIEAFAPLNGMIDDSPRMPEVLSEAKRNSLHDEALKQLAVAADYISSCGYHRRDKELAELQAVLRGEMTFASLPPRV